MQVKFRDTQFTSPKLDQYRQQCRGIETAPTEATERDFQTTYGIVERRRLSELSQFDITKQLPQDIMHILLEGAVQYEVRFILQHFFDSGVMTLQKLNSAFSQLSLAYHDEKNRPPPLRESTFNGQETYKMKQTAEQARIFLKNLPFVLICSSGRPLPSTFATNHLNCTDLFFACHQCYKNPRVATRNRGTSDEFQGAFSNHYTRNSGVL